MLFTNLKNRLHGQKYEYREDGGGGGGGAPLHTFAAVPRGCLQFVIVVFPDHTHYFCQGHYFEKE